MYTITQYMLDILCVTMHTYFLGTRYKNVLLNKPFLYIECTRGRIVNLVTMSKQRISSKCIEGCHSLQDNMYCK